MFIQMKIHKSKLIKVFTRKKVSNDGPLEVLNQEDTNNLLIKNLLQINGVTGVFLGEDFFSINKEENKKWEDIQHIVISYVNEHYANGNTCIIDKINEEDQTKIIQRLKKIISILDSKIRPAVARDGGDIKFQEFKDGKVKVLLKGSCSGCPSSTLTLKKKKVENLLCHYIPEVKEVLAV